MNLEYFNHVETKKKMALIFGALTFILTFRSNSLLLFTGLTAFSGFIGYLLGYSKQRIEKTRYRYPIYIFLSLLLLIPILVTIYTQYQGCLGGFPYEAKNIFTGETKTFIHGGCGPRTEHPWYYEIIDTNSGGILPNQTN